MCAVPAGSSTPSNPVLVASMQQEKEARPHRYSLPLSERVSTFRDAMASYPSQTRHLHRLQHPGFLCVPHVTISELRGVQWCTHEDGRVLVEMEGDGKQGWLRVLE